MAIYEYGCDQCGDKLTISMSIKKSMGILQYKIHCFRNPKSRKTDVIKVISIKTVQQGFEILRF